MSASKILPLTLGFLALASGIVMITFNLILSTTATKHHLLSSASVASHVASALSFVTAGLLLVLVGRQFQFQNHIQDRGNGRLRVYLLAGLTSIFTVASAIATAISLIFFRSNMTLLPHKVISTPAPVFIMGAFVIWALSLALQVIFLICMVAIQRKDFHQQIQPYITNSEPQTPSDMQETARPRHNLGQQAYEYSYSRNNSMESKTPTSFGGRSRAGSDAMGSMGSFQSSMSHVVRPITSKTRLIHSSSQRSTSQRSNFRPSSVESNHCETIASVEAEDDFDSWNTSQVDAQARQVIESASASPPRFLETIPASPTGSRSPSPGFPLDLEPPRTRNRSRSYSPATSIRSGRSAHRSRAISPEVEHEAHIHPLFRSDSPGPALEMTPGTMVTAAPGAGSIISDVHSIRSVRMRSDSNGSRVRSDSQLETPPRPHSPSLESIRRALEEEEKETAEVEEGERSLTPPIPEWILGAGPRTSMSEYNRKKAKSQGRSGKNGESMDY